MPLPVLKRHLLALSHHRKCVPLRSRHLTRAPLDPGGRDVSCCRWAAEGRVHERALWGMLV